MNNKRGYLTKQPGNGHMFSSARRRFFVLDGSMLKWYESEVAARAGASKGHLQLAGARMVRQGAQLVVKAGEQRLAVRGDDLDAWEQCLRAVVSSASPETAPSELAGVVLEDDEGPAESPSSSKRAEEGTASPKPLRRQYTQEQLEARAAAKERRVAESRARKLQHSAPSTLATEDSLDAAASALDEQRELARPNASTIRALSELDSATGVVEALGEGRIRLVRSSWLLKQPVTYRMEKRQRLEERERDGESPLLEPHEAVDLVRRADRSVGVVSHGWLSPGDVRRRSTSHAACRALMRAEMHAAPPQNAPHSAPHRPSARTLSLLASVSSFCSAHSPDAACTASSARSPTQRAHGLQCCESRSYGFATSRPSSSTSPPSIKRPAPRSKTPSSYVQPIPKPPPSQHPMSM